MDPSGITAVTILAEKKPKTVGEERQLIGFLSYYRRYIPNFACLAKPLYVLLTKPKSASGSKHTTRRAPEKNGNGQLSSATLIMWTENHQQSMR